MWKFLTGLSALLLSACATSPVVGSAQEPGLTPANASSARPIVIGQQYTIDSAVLNERRELNVWLPPSYVHGDERYPVLYLIDGGIDQDFQHISALAQLGALNGAFESPIVIGVKTNNRLLELTSELTDPRYIRTAPSPVGKAGRFRDYLQQEVLPWAESHYRVNDRRIVIGESLAGLFIAETFLLKPQLFTDYVSVSPSLWWDDRALAKAAPKLLLEHDGGSRQLYLTMADEGGTMQSGLDMVLAALAANKPAGLQYHYVDRRASHTHSTIFHEAALDALGVLLGLPLPDYGPTPWYLIEGGQPPAESE